MAIEVTMPKLGLTMTEGLLSRWLVRDGEEVSKGQPIFELETDKARLEAEALADGTLRIVVEAGSTIPVTGLVGYILKPGEEMPSVVQGTGADVEVFAEARAKPAKTVATGIRASPLARRMAQEAGIDLASIQGTGRGGRITKEDVERTTAEQRPPTQVETPTTEAEMVPISGVRSLIAERMLASSQQTASVTITSEVDATELVNMRAQLNEFLSEQLGFRLSYNAILVKIVVRALREFPYMNARQEGDSICLLPEVHIGLAVDTERGLLVPVVREADMKSIPQIGRELRDKAQRAIAGKILPDELGGGTFTITNLGAFGVGAFTSIINPPEMAILGIGRIEQAPMAYKGEMCLRHRLILSLTFDHRLVDGAPAARFLQRIRELIEKPYLLM